jgi:glycosyltransferase involved in cell wall biosynthesis
MSTQKVAIFGPQYTYGGGGHVCADIGKALGRRGYDVDFLIDGRTMEGGYLRKGFPDSCSLVQISGARIHDSQLNLPYYASLLKGLWEYLIRNRNVTLLSNFVKKNLISTWVSLITPGSHTVILCEHTMIGVRMTGNRRVLPPLIRAFYPLADRAVAVSGDITGELIADFGLSRDMCTTVDNPIDVENIQRLSEHSVSHMWFEDDPPVILGVGRFGEAKDFVLLVRALEVLRQKVPARLVLLGDGDRRGAIEQQVEASGLEEHVDLLGFVDNPYKYMRQADMLAHPADYEGFGLVLPEAMACGTPVVAADCPGGPSDILKNGEYGALVEVGNDKALADAIYNTLKDPPPAEKLKSRAQDFDIEKVVQQYIDVIES